jgi:GlcNAc-PI de-N-acetylase
MFADPINEFEGIVVITVPHMDDEVLACGGTIGSLADKDCIHLIYATDGLKSPVPMYPWSGATAPDMRPNRVLFR